MSEPPRTWPPAAPESLPSPLRRDRRGPKEEQTSIRLRLTTTTPIYGGSARPRKVDPVDVIRAASIRGQLRFWWRALHAHEYAQPEQLYTAECALWGSPGGNTRGGRSRVELRGEVLDRAPERLKELLQEGTPAQPDQAYALFPARGEKRPRGTEPGKAAERYAPGITFGLDVRVPVAHHGDVRDALLAWLLFGGYGGRTRRGLGSLTVADDQHRKEWLPGRASKEAIGRLFGRDIFAPASFSPIPPVLTGAEWFSGVPVRSPEKAWETAVSWLRTFRQGVDGPNPAREPGTRDRPGRSRWPEADKIRQLSPLPPGMSWAHDPRHCDIPAWPRAVLGLPIIGQFQHKGRSGRFFHEQDPPRLEPEDFELGWLKDGRHHDRLASPLIVKALPLADGTFAPLALWLSREHPPGEVVLRDRPGSSDRRRNERPRAAPRGSASSAAAFSTLNVDESPQFGLLARHADLRALFFAWLEEHVRATASPSSMTRHRHDRNAPSRSHRR